VHGQGEWGGTEAAMGNWVAFAIGVSGLLLIEMFVFRF
jgi:hypothetical protein